MPRMEPATMLIHSRDGGFFSNFNCVMSNLEALLGHNGCVAATVDWTAPNNGSHFVYGDRQDGNVWLHFFEPLRFAQIPARQFDVWDYPTPRATLISGKEAYATYKFNPFWRRRYHALFSRYVTIKPFLTARAEAIFNARVAGRFCIGVHYRNPRHGVECPSPIPPPEVFVERVRALLPAGRDAAIFLATDFEPAVAVFQVAFGDALVLQPAVSRADAGAVDQMHHITVDPSLKLGEQVLVDCLLLARCQVLLHVTSNVATTAGYINPRLRLVYCETPAQAWHGYTWAAAWMLELWLRTGWGKPLFPLFRRLYRLGKRLRR
jgi:hypothetical protein